VADRDPWDWREGQCWHESDTNGDPYRCPVAGCWWNDPASHTLAVRDA
jgi:hypothetical protein